jgi:hypothetical protein
MFAIPDRTAHVTKFADWLEFGAIQSPNGRIGFSTLVSASDLSTEEQSEDISDEEIWEDELVLGVQNEINSRAKIIGQDYPFAIDPHGTFLTLTDQVTPIGSVYLFCLFLSHVTDRTIVPASAAPPVNNNVRDLFQACATIAAAGYVDGYAVSFGWPRPDDSAFLAALHKTYAIFGDGKPHKKPRPAAPPQSKDEGIDVIAWRPSPDGLAGTMYLLGQTASGDNWKDKSVKDDAELFHEYWFERRPGSRHQDAMFMPFCLEPKSSRDDATAQETLVDHMQRLTGKFGLLFYRYRMASFAALGLAVHLAGKMIVERVDDLPRVETWVQDYSTTLRAH